MKGKTTPRLLLGCAILWLAFSTPLRGDDDATMPRWLTRRPIANPLGFAVSHYLHYCDRRSKRSIHGIIRSKHAAEPDRKSLRICDRFGLRLDLLV
jgi:hypothetical protein